jgi:hypothetical protein
MITTLLESELPEGETAESLLIELLYYNNIVSSQLPGFAQPIPKYEILRVLDPSFVVLPPSLPQVIATVTKEYEDAVNAHIQAECTAAGFDDITSACAYAATANPLQAQSASFINWRAAVWLYCKDQLAKVQDGTLPVPPPPSVEDYIAALPTRIIPT